LDISLLIPGNIEVTQETTLLAHKSVLISTSLCPVSGDTIHFETRQVGPNESLGTAEALVSIDDSASIDKFKEPF
jgi:hypothetical protein